MNDEILIQVDHVSKKFCKSLKRAIVYGGMDIARNIFGRDVNSDLRQNEFWAVNDADFIVRRGECVGLIGPNGAGKSTLLKMLNGVYPPDQGSITLRGTIGALIELGAGFHPMLTGRENIFIAGAIKGMSKKQITKKFDQIVEFAELAEFIDTPVKFYSSGMFVRLGFAVAAQMDPDVFLIDEVLAVGDVGFRSKCYNYVAHVNKKAAIVFVSHSMPQVVRICDRIIVMNHGQTAFDGDLVTGIDQYRSLFPLEESSVTGSGEAKLHSLTIQGPKQDDAVRVSYGQPFVCDLSLSVDASHKSFVISTTFMNQDLQLVAQCQSSYNKQILNNTGKPMDIQLTIPQLMLNPGKYAFSILVYDSDNKKQLLWHHCIQNMQVVADFIGGAPVQWQGQWSVL